MAKSTITVKVLGDHVRVTAARPAFLDREGTIRVGPGDPVEDVRRARKLMGIKGPVLK